MDLHDWRTRSPEDLKNINAVIPSNVRCSARSDRTENEEPHFSKFFDLIMKL